MTKYKCLVEHEVANEFEGVVTVEKYKVGDIIEADSVNTAMWEIAE